MDEKILSRSGQTGKKGEEGCGMEDEDNGYV
jgi:hypothetical protein